MSPELFRNRYGNRIYTRTRKPCTVFFAKDMGKGTFKQRLLMVQQYRQLRQFIVGEWEYHYKHAENNFADNFNREFWPGWFELRCSSLLRSKGLKNRATGGGPDFVFDESKLSARFSLEATILTPGNSGASSVASFDAPRHSGEFVIKDVSEHITDISDVGVRANTKNTDSQWNMSLRVTNTLNNKRNQIQNWMDSERVDCKQPIVVAISPTYLETETNRTFYSEDMERALYGKGYQVVQFAPDSNRIRKEIDNEFKSEKSMQNNSGASVELGLFLNQCYSYISAVLLIQDNLFLSSARETHLYINPLASNKFTDTPMLGDQTTTYRHGCIETERRHLPPD